MKPGEIITEPNSDIILNPDRESITLESLLKQLGYFIV